ncbi:MAG: hypothetical protein RJQ08_03560 [Salinisphaeraceae bacterium]
MYMILTLVLMSLAGAQLSTLTGELYQDFREIDRQRLAIEAANVAAAVAEFEDRFARYPDDLDELVAEADYATLELDIDPRIVYELRRDVSMGAGGGAWTFDRALVFARDPFAHDSNALFLSDNQCGGDFTVDPASFCPPRAIFARVLEDASRPASAIAVVREHLIRTLGVMADHFSIAGGFPTEGGGAVEMDPGDAAFLGGVVGYAGGGPACGGTYVLGGVFVSCDSLFDPVYGNPVEYVYIDSNHAVLQVQTPIQDESGNPVFIAEEIFIPASVL